MSKKKKSKDSRKRKRKYSSSEDESRKRKSGERKKKRKRKYSSSSSEECEKKSKEKKRRKEKKKKTKQAETEVELPRKGPMTKEEWEKRQSVVRRVFDPDTGRHRLIKGDGEVLEEIVSRQRQQEINKMATKGDGDSFQAMINKRL